MNINKIDEISNELLKDFVDYIGLDGNYFISNKTCPVMFDNTLYPGKFISPTETRSINAIISSLNNEKAKNIIKSRGIIKINKKYMNTNELDSDLLVTLVHEKIHSYRNLLVYDVHLKNNQSSYLSNNNKFEQNNKDYNSFYADASQNILKGSIDNSIKTIDSYKNKSLKELDIIEFNDDILNKKMKRQHDIDEALVEVMAILSYQLYSAKEKDEKFDIWKALEKIKSSKKLDDDVTYMSELILKHHDFELFYWMLDPITYQSGDIHYDFFTNYTKNDHDLVEKICSASNLGMDDLSFDEEVGKLR